MDALERLARLSREHGFGVVVVAFPILVDFEAGHAIAARDVADLRRRGLARPEAP